MIINFSGPANPKGRFVSSNNIVVIGRVLREANALDLYPDMGVSHHHARVSIVGGEYWIEDLGSTNGTWINGKRTHLRTRVQFSDQIRVGETKIEIVIEPLLSDPAPQGTVSARLSASEAAPDLLIGEDKKQDGLFAIVAARRRLSTFYQLLDALGAVSALDALPLTFLEHLRKAVPVAERVGLFLRDGTSFAFKGHLPQHESPSASRSLLARAYELREAFIWRTDTSTITTMLTDTLTQFQTKSAVYAPLIWRGEIVGVTYLDNTVKSDAFVEDDLRLVMAMGNLVAMFVKNYTLQQDLRQAELARSNLMRHFPPKVAEQMLQQLNQRGNLWVGGHKVDPVTILVTDVRNAANLTQALHPDDLVIMLNDMFSVLVPIVFKHDGTVDKYVSDSLIAVFGSPEPDRDQWLKAVRAAFEMQEAMRRLAEGWRANKRMVCEIGIGIHSGEAVHGFVGSPERMEFMVIGSTLDIASRYCGGAQVGEIIISPQVHERIAVHIEVGPEFIIQARRDRDEANLPARKVMLLKA